MSYQIDESNEQINDINREQYIDLPPDNEIYILFNGQGNTPTGDEIDLNMNINNSFSNNINDNAVFEHSNNNIDNFMDNEYSAAPVPVRRRISESDNSNENNIDNEKDLNESNNIIQDEIKNFEEYIENDEKYLNPPFVNDDFSCFHPNFLDSGKEIHNNLLNEDNFNVNNINNINNEVNEIDDERNNINIEKITPYPGMNESISQKKLLNSDNSLNFNIMDAPINNNNLSNSSSSQNTNITNLSNSNIPSKNLNSSVIYSHTFDPQKFKNRIDKEDFITTNNLNDNESSNEKKKTKKKYLRKFKPDSLRKKIKSRMHKKLKFIMNKKLKKCGSKMFFDYFPQPFITNINVKDNKYYLKLTMRTLFKMVFGNKAKDKEKVDTNLKVIKYLDSNDKIRIESGIDIFLNSTYEDIIQQYINGKLFEEDVKILSKEGETKEYIEKYKLIGKHWLEFYNNNGKKIV